MNTDFLEQCYGTEVFCALEMLSVIVTGATRKFSSLHLGFIFLVSKKKGTGDVTCTCLPEQHVFAVCYILGTHKLTACVWLDSPVVRVLQRYEFHTSVCFLPLKCHVSHTSVIKMIKMTIVKQKLQIRNSDVICGLCYRPLQKTP